MGCIRCELSLNESNTISEKMELTYHKRNTMHWLLMACLLESAASTFCAFGCLTFPARSCRKRRMANQSEFPNAMSADRFERMFPDDEACAEDLFRRRWPDGFVCPDCGSGNAVRLKRPRCVRQCRDCRKQTSAAAGTFMHRSHVPPRSWHRALHIMTSHSNGMSALQLQHRLGLGSYKSAWMPVHKIRRAMDAADGFPLIMNVQADETGIPYRLKGSEPPPGGRSHEGRLMIAGAVEVFGENSPGCAELRRDHGPVRPDAEGVPRRRDRSGNLDRGRRLGRLRRAGEPHGDCGRRQAGA